MEAGEGRVRFGLGSATLLLLLGCSAAEPRERPATPAADCPSASVEVVERPAAEAPPSASAPERAPPVAAEEVKEAPREPFLHTFPGDVELEITYTPPQPVSTVARIRLGEQIVFPSECGKKTTEFCSRAHRTLRGEPGGDEHDDSFDKGRQLLLAQSWGDDKAVYILFGATVIGSPLCGTHAFWALRADAEAVRVTEPISGCFLGGAGTSDDVVASELYDTEPAAIVLRSPSHGPPGKEVMALYTLDEHTMTFTRRFVGKTAKNWPNAR
ncbi:MAG: hypothetical protein JNL21_12710 [Myxococcales bacterium]|nr:hypothetical protein [Myxococcales bacterium]